MFAATCFAGPGLHGFLVFKHRLLMKCMANLSLGVICMMLLSCIQKADETRLADENVKLVKQYFDRFNAHDWQGLGDLYAGRVEIRDPADGGGRLVKTRKQLTDKYASMQDVFADIHDEIITIYPSGSHHVIVEFESTGTAPDSSKFRLPICTIFGIAERQIVKDYTYYDNVEDMDR